MAQQFKKDEETRPIKRAGVIRPKEPVDVYVTQKVASSPSNRYNVGDKVTLHRVAAERWIEKGKGTATQKEALATAPKDAKKTETGGGTPA